LVAIEPVLILMKDLGFILGIGGATAAVFIFLKFLDDFNLDHKEVGALKSFYESIWLGLALVFISKYFFKRRVLYLKIKKYQFFVLIF
jgi:hypothetical protein